MRQSRRGWLRRVATSGLAMSFPVRGLVQAAETACGIGVDAMRAPFTDRLPEITPPLLVGANGAPVKTAKDWDAARILLRERWDRFLGPAISVASEPKTEIVEEQRHDGYRRQSLRWRVEPETWLDAHLLVPEVKPPAAGFPAIIALHQTSNQTIDEIAGVERSGVTVRPDQARAVDLARAGFVVFCPKNFLWQDVPNFDAAVQRFRSRHPQTRGMAKMLFDSRQAVDQLLRIAPQVDSQRIGAFGHSLGAKEVVYLMAFDERIRAGVASDGGTGFDQTNWDAPWYLGKGCAQDAAAAGLAPHQLLALASPRPLLIVAGGHERGGADGDGTRPYIHAARQVDHLLTGEHRLGYWNHGQGHALTNDIFACCHAWLKRFV